MDRGKFVVIDGIDGAGKKTQSMLLKKFLENHGNSVLLLSYPDYRNPIGKFINEFLHGKASLPVEIQFILYAGDMLKDKEKIERVLEDGKWIIADRYITTTAAYQGAKGFPMENAEQFVNIFSIPKPDIVMYLKIMPETGMKRKAIEKEGKLDRFESNKAFLHKVSGFYDMLAERNFLSKWTVIDGEKCIEDVFSQLKKALDL